MREIVLTYTPIVKDLAPLLLAVIGLVVVGLIFAVFLSRAFFQSNKKEAN
jgi:uncharacterized integral membrane protein